MRLNIWAWMCDKRNCSHTESKKTQTKNNSNKQTNKNSACVIILVWIIIQREI